MADPSELTLPFENLRILSELSRCMGASIDPTYVTALASERECAISSSLSTFFPACSEPVSSETKKSERGDDKSVEDAIELSKVHWSQLIEHCEFDDEEEAEVSNVKVFQSLQKHPTWGKFFKTFGDGGIYDFCELEVGEKFAEGGQAELYHAHVAWKNPKFNSIDQEIGYMYVLKVFRNGTFLRDLQKQWPQGMFRKYEETVSRQRCGESVLRKYTCNIHCRTLLPDGRFAFLLVRENEDLQTLIDRCMKARACNDCGPFSRDMEIYIMRMVARGMLQLHNLNIVHRDLKASNVLCARIMKKMDKYVYDFDVPNEEVPTRNRYDFYVADFECSMGVVGTGFFRALEILQVVKDKVLNKNPNLFTKEVDVYSYGMVCYEILTGKLPFEGHRKNDYDLVLKGSRPEVPDHVEEWAHDLLYRCWQLNPAARPTFEEIINLVSEAFWKPQNA